MVSALLCLIALRAQLAQTLAGGALALEPVKGADCRVEARLRAFQLGLCFADVAVSGGASLDVREGVAHCIRHDALDKRGTDRHAPLAVSVRRAAVEVVAAVVGRSDDHTGAAGAAAE